MSYRYVDVQSSDKVEVITVRDERHEEPHFLLLLTVQSATVETTEVKRYLAGKFDIKAIYLFGPLSEEIGKTVCHMGGETSLNDGVSLSNGDILVHVTKMRGLNVASFMLNRVVRWAKCFEAERKVRPFKLVKHDATIQKNKDRRNQLYRKFGMRIVFEDPATEEEGHTAYDLLIAELLEFDDREWANISVNYWLDGFRALYGDHLIARRRLRESNRTLSRYRRKSERFDAKVRTIRNALAYIVNWPLVAATAVVGYGVGAGEWRTYLAVVKHHLGF